MGYLARGDELTRGPGGRRMKERAESQRCANGGWVNC